jgi:hypothetical protein
MDRKHEQTSHSCRRERYCSYQGDSYLHDSFLSRVLHFVSGMENELLSCFVPTKVYARANVTAILRGTSLWKFLFHSEQATRKGSAIVMSEIVPSEQELLNVITSIKQAEPELGIKKVLAALNGQQPTWTVSEKRVKKLMQILGLVQSTHLVKSGVEDDPSVPVSFIDPKLDLKATSSAIEVSRILMYDLPVSVPNMLCHFPCRHVWWIESQERVFLQHEI